MADQWSIRATKKGDLSVTNERRPLGKDVTLIKMVEANPDLLLRELKLKFGTGGSQYGSTVEIQGLHVEHVREYLLGHGSRLKGLNKSLLPSQPSQSAARAGNAATEAEEEWWKFSANAPKVRSKPRHRREPPAVKPPAASILGSFISNCKERCPMNWPYCSGWCYEPDSPEALQHADPSVGSAAIDA